MKKIILLSILFLFCISLPVRAFDDTSNKAVVESLASFSFDNDKSTVKFKVIEENTFDNGIVFEKDSIVTAHVMKIVEAKRGKRNGYLVVEPVSYSIPSKGNETLNINEEYWVANVVGYKPFDVKKAAFSAGLSAAGYFVKGIGQIYYFGKGIISPNEGEGRLKSGAKNVYENSPLAFIKEGEEINIQKGDILLLKFHYDNVPKWRFFKRNK